MSAATDAKSDIVASLIASSFSRWAFTEKQLREMERPAPELHRLISVMFYVPIQHSFLFVPVMAVEDKVIYVGVGVWL